MKHKPSETILTKIDAFILSTIESNTGITQKELEKRIFNRYGYSVDVKERLKEYTPKDQDGQFFIFWN